MTSKEACGLIDLIKEGQQLVADAREQRTRDYATRCAAWAIMVEFALKDDALALARFRQAAPYKGVESGIPYSIMGDWQVTRGRLAVLMPLAAEETANRRDTGRYWLLAIIAILTAVVGGVVAWPIIKHWLRII